MTRDPLLEVADEWHRLHVWLEHSIDEETAQSGYCLAQERRLRAQVRQRGEEARDLAEVTQLTGGAVTLRRVV